MIRTVDRGIVDAAIRRSRMRPDYTLPLRLQTSGQSALSREGIEINRALWWRALSDGSIWRRAFVAGLIVGTMETLLDPRAADLPMLSRVSRLVMLIAMATGVIVFSAAGNRVRGAMIKRDVSNN